MNNERSFVMLLLLTEKTTSRLLIFEMVTVSVSPISFLSNSMQTTTIKTVTLGFTSVKDIITA